MGVITIDHVARFHHEMAKIPINRLVVQVFAAPDWTGIKTIEGLSLQHPFTTFFLVPTDLLNVPSEYEFSAVNEYRLPYFKFVKNGDLLFDVWEADIVLINDKIRRFDPTRNKWTKPAPVVVPEPFQFPKFVKATKEIKKVQGGMRKKMPAGIPSSLDVAACSSSTSLRAQEWKELYDKTYVQKADANLANQMKECTVEEKATRTPAGMSTSTKTTRIKIHMGNKELRVYTLDLAAPISMIREMMLTDFPKLAGTRFHLSSCMTHPYRVLRDESVSIQDAGLANSKIEVTTFSR